ncbi:MAG: hypothetical protein GC205_05100 [Bacteroidetes bacterium]|nr:hypothetical protein [Bacteroidota bacterium]
MKVFFLSLFGFSGGRRPGSKLVVTGVVVLAGLLALTSSGCRKENLTNDPDAVLRFSTDTLQFDTVFASVGSATREFLIFNPEDQAIRISSIELAGGAGSFFRINVDGIPGALQEDIEVRGRDSIYVFVEVTIDPNDDRMPYVIEDSIVMITNGNRQSVLLVAWGQNANFFSGQRLCDEIWEDNLPYVIYNYVQVDSGCTLTIREGCRVHFHANSGMLIDGTLLVEGTPDSTVTFLQDRLEPFFRDLPGQWDGLFFLRGSTGNVLRNAVIKNSREGLLCGFSKSPNLSDFNAGNMPEVQLENVIIQDIQGNGIISLLSDIQAENTLIYNCGASNAALLLGGRYDFRHATLANFGSIAISHQTPILVLSNFYNFGQDEGGSDIILESDLEQADFRNVIVEGNILREQEIVLGNLEQSASFNHLFSHSLLRTRISTDTINTFNCIFNESPLFVDRSERNYRLDEGSPAIDAGFDIGLGLDLDGNVRPFAGTLPDIGAYESGYE